MGKYSAHVRIECKIAEYCTRIIFAPSPASIPILSPYLRPVDEVWF